MIEINEIPYAYPVFIMIVVTNVAWYASKAYIKSQGGKYSWYSHHLRDFKELTLIGYRANDGRSRLVSFLIMIGLICCLALTLYLIYLSGSSLMRLRGS